MRRKNSLPELLCPAGDFEALIAAVQGGADAVYVGGKIFSARAYAKNFDLNELSLAVSYCHIHGVKLYVTVNTLIYDREMEELSNYARELYNIGVDAVIVADIGAIREIRRRVPNLEIHASTQCSVHNTDSANQLNDIGVTRVVLARELPLSDISSVVENSPLEVEVFLHGALCVSYSGQCLMSSLIGGRSGNRGECAQPCRLPYGKGYPLSLKDLSLADHICELIDSGVCSLKIEGRMKSPSYVYTVTKIYRKLLDERRGPKKEEKELLLSAFSRGGFTDGYFVAKTERGMTGVRSEADKKRSEEIIKEAFVPMRASVSAFCKIKRGERAMLLMTYKDRIATVYGAVPEDAKNAPLTGESVYQRIAKLGSTYFSLAKENFEIELDEGLNISPAELNAMRRDAAQKLIEPDFEKCFSEYTPPVRRKRKSPPLVTAEFLSGELYSEMRSKACLGLDKIDVAFLPADYGKNYDVAKGVSIPPIIFDGERERVKKMLISAKEGGAKYALVSNIGAFRLAKEIGFEIVGGFRLNISNCEAFEFYSELGAIDSVLSAELTLPMARDIGGGEITLGRIPLMLTERCFMRENFGCDKCGSCSLSDRTGKRFSMIRVFDHRNIILNSTYTYMGDKRRELYAAGITHEHFIFSTESATDAEKLLLAYFGEKKISFEVRRVGKRDAAK